MFKCSLAQPRVGRQQGDATPLQSASTRHMIQSARISVFEGLEQISSNILDLLGEGNVGGRTRLSVLPRLGIVKKFVEVRSGIWQ